jgi:hypothetical protein
LLLSATGRLSGAGYSTPKSGVDMSSVIGGPDSDLTVAVWRLRDGLPGGIGLGLSPLLPVRRRHLVRSEKARIVPGDDSPG